ncbi:hypothetical protein NE235_07285 [Actinoallomurus spadix]|uniref:Secreted protein n=1 Tax=Actinoallomurus spadix TaxID=79912 RepID=A0ABP3FN95_9ACTN|nr:hypothetical protein [Actinoallomurus spadix]MCO5985906.1 hypothetical protein [Actinoallomurus spadix]
MKARSIAMALGLVVAAGTSTAAPADATTGSRAEFFAANETSGSFDPNDPVLKTRLTAFAHQVEGIIRTNGGRPHGSTLLNGTFWDSGLQKADYERSREFHVDGVTPVEVHDIAHVLAVTYHQQSVLTFRYLPRRSKDVNAVQVKVPGVSFQKLHDVIQSEPALGEELGGGSVTPGGRLIELGAVSDLPLIKRLVAEVGADWAQAKVAYGAWEFVG